MADRLNREWASAPVRVYAVMEYYRTTQTNYIKELKARGYTDAETEPMPGSPIRRCSWPSILA